MIKIKVPGKLYLAGEYAVINPKHYAIIIPVNRYLKAEIIPKPRLNYSEIISGKKLLKIDFINLKPNQKFTKFWQEVGQSLIVIKKYLDFYHIKLQNFKLIFKSQLVDSTFGKFGMGSSGAVKIATIKAISTLYQIKLTPLKIFKLAIQTQTENFAQTSYGDLAVASFQKPLLFQKPQSIEDPPLIKTFTWPKNLDIAIGFTGQPYHTIEGVNKYQKLLENEKKPFEKKSNELTLTFYQKLCKQKNIYAVFQQISDLYWNFDQKNDIGIFTPKLQKLVKIAHSFNMPAKQSGAGGGDCGITLCPSKIKPKLIDKWQKAGIIPLENEVL